MINLWEENYDIVYTIREDDQISSRFKRKMATLFYAILNILSDTKVEFGTADFRLLDRKVIDVLKNNLNEYYLFYRGLLPWIGFTQIGIRYKAQPRFAGKSKYTCAKMFNFATHGITGFTIKPLRMAIYCGLVVSMIAFLYGGWAVYQHLIFHRTFPGWTSLLISILFLGGIQILFIGVLGEYLGKMFFEIKKRPHYIIKEKSL
jgi:dolichol-phosphate mannosyltransferase